MVIEFRLNFLQLKIVNLKQILKTSTTNLI